MPMPTLGELFGAEFRDSQSKKFSANEKEIIDKFFELLKNKFKGAKLKNSYYYNKYSDWYPYLYTDFIDKTYKIGKKEYVFNFSKIFIEGKKRISQLYMRRYDKNSLPGEYERASNNSHPKIITAIMFDIRGQSHGGQSKYFFIPTLYNIDNEPASGLTETCAKNIRKIYFPKMIRLFKNLK